MTSMDRYYNTTVDGGPDPTPVDLIDWPTRIGRCLIGFGLDAGGYPVNPVQPHLPPGRGDLWHWGEAVAADAIVFSTGDDGIRKLLIIERGDGHGFALPGGCLNRSEPPEQPRQAVARELAEETGLRLAVGRFTEVERPGGGHGWYVPDPRAGRAAWMVTVPFIATLRPGEPTAVAGADDADRAVWLPADTFADLTAAITSLGGTVFASHQKLLKHVLA